MADGKVVTLSILFIVTTLFILLNAKTYNLERLGQDYPELVVILFFVVIGFVGINLYK